MKFWPWLQSIPSESDGRGSTVRVCILFTFLTINLCIIYLVITNPDKLSMLIGAFTAFLMGVTGALYGINQAKDILGARKGESLNKEQ